MKIERGLTHVVACLAVVFGAMTPTLAQTSKTPSSADVPAKPFRLKLGSSFIDGAFAFQGTYDFSPAKSKKGWTVSGFLDYTGGSVLGVSWSLIGVGAEARMPLSDPTNGSYFYGALGAGFYNVQAGDIYSGYGASGVIPRAYLGYEFSRSYMVELGLIDTSIFRIGMRF